MCVVRRLCGFLPSGEEIFGKSNCKLKDNVKPVFKEIECGSVEWI